MARENNLIRSGYIQARKITHIHARTFYFASLFLKTPQKKAAYAIYAFCRGSDDAVDTQDISTRSTQLSQMKEKLEHVYAGHPLDTPLLCAFRQTIEQYHIPKAYFDDLLAGMQMDLEKSRYGNFQELLLYCYRVAGVIGLIMLKVFQSSHPKANQHAISLGIAMQLTNILRDIREDYLNNRIYLPRDEMDRFEISEEHLAKGKIDGRFIQFMQFQIRRARQYYRDSSGGIQYIKTHRSRYVVQLMKEMYGKILDEIELKKYDIFSQRVFVPLHKKIMISLKAIAGDNS